MVKSMTTSEALSAGTLTLRDGAEYTVALFSLPRERRIRCQCVRVERLCNKPIYSKVVFITDGRDFCVYGYACALAHAVVRPTHVRAKRDLASVPELTDAEIDRVRALILGNVKDVIPYLVALRDQRESDIQREEERLQARRLPMAESDHAAFSFATSNAARARSDSQRLALAESLQIRARNVHQLRVSVDEVLAYSRGQGGLSPVLVRDILNDDDTFYRPLAPNA
ncbi:MAG: hypothetical protein ACK4F8_11660 [Aquabacterium sp.]